MMGQDPPARSLLRAPTTIDLRPSFYNKRSPFRLLQESDSVRTSIADGYRTSFYNRRAPAAGFLQRPIASGVCRTSPMPSEVHRRPTLHQIPHEIGLFRRIIFRRASTSGKSQTDFPSNQTPTGLHQQKVSIRASTADDFCL